MCLAGKVPPGHVPNYLYVRRFSMYPMSNSESIAFAKVIKCGLLSLRFASKKVSPEQIFDLTDALHNVPDIYMGVNSMNTEDILRMYFDTYDTKWYGKDVDALGISLRKEFDSVIKGIA